MLTCIHCQYKCVPHSFDKHWLCQCRQCCFVCTGGLPTTREPPWNCGCLGVMCHPACGCCKTFGEHFDNPTAPSSQRTVNRHMSRWCVRRKGRCHHPDPMPMSLPHLASSHRPQPTGPIASPTTRRPQVFKRRFTVALQCFACKPLCACKHWCLQVVKCNCAWWGATQRLFLGLCISVALCSRPVLLLC